MKKSTARLGILGTAALSIGLVLAQGGSSYSGPKVEINYVHGYSASDQVVMDAMIKKFNASHDNIAIKGQLVPWDTTWQQLPSLVAAGKAPDVVAMTENVIGNFMARNALSELSASEIKDAKITGSLFYKNLWTAGFYEGKQFGVPLSNAAQVMYYNKDLLKKSGVTKIPKTRDEFIKAAQACTSDKAGKHPSESGFDASNLETYGAGIMTPWMGATLAYGILRGNGGDLVDSKLNAAFNSKAGIDAVQLMLDLIGKYNISPNKLTEGADITSFKAGKTCFNFNGVWQLTNYSGAKGLSLGVAPLPKLGTRKAAAWGASVHLVLPLQKSGYDANRRAASLEFVRWMSAPDQNLFWTTSGALPTQAGVAKSKDYASSPMADVVAGLDSLYIPTGFAWVNQVRGAWDGAIEAAMLGKKTVKQALDDGVKEAQVRIEEVRQSMPK